ncbi:hypothetical protein GCM10027048_04280 [Hymenobacter coalescens]
MAALRPAAHAQRALVQEFAGSTVLLTSGDTLRGPLTLYAERDVLLVHLPDRTVRTVAAMSVAAFAVRGELNHPGDYFEQARDFSEPRRGYASAGSAWVPAVVARERPPDTLRTRLFRSLPWNHGYDYADYRTPAFFEQLSRGPVLLLRRQSLIERAVSAADPMFMPTYSGAALPRGTVGYYVTARSQFFLCTASGEVLPLRNPRRHLLAYFRAEAAALEQYARQHRLSFSSSRDLARLVDYANALREPPQP